MTIKERTVTRATRSLGYRVVGTACETRGRGRQVRLTPEQAMAFIEGEYGELLTKLAH